MCDTTEAQLYSLVGKQKKKNTIAKTRLKQLEISKNLPSIFNQLPLPQILKDNDNI